MKVLSFLVILCIALTGCLENFKLKRKPADTIGYTVEYGLQTTAPPYKVYGTLVNPFIVLFSGNAGNISAYYRVDGHIEYHGPELTGKFAAECDEKQKTCWANLQELYANSYITFRTIDGCSIRWSQDFLVSETEITLQKKPLLGKCYAPAGAKPKKETPSYSPPPLQENVAIDWCRRGLFGGWMKREFGFGGC